MEWLLILVLKSHMAGAVSPYHEPFADLETCERAGQWWIALKEMEQKDESKKWMYVCAVSLAKEPEPEKR